MNFLFENTQATFFLLDFPLFQWVYSKFEHGFGFSVEKSICKWISSYPTRFVGDKLIDHFICSVFPFSVSYFHYMFSYFHYLFLYFLFPFRIFIICFVFSSFVFVFSSFVFVISLFVSKHLYLVHLFYLSLFIINQFYSRKLIDSWKMIQFKLLLKSSNDWIHNWNINSGSKQS